MPAPDPGGNRACRRCLPAVVAVGADARAHPETRTRTRTGDHVTDPDPLAELAAQVAELRGQLARTQGEVGVLRERLKAESGRTAMLPLQVKPFRAELAEGGARTRPQTPPPRWRCGSWARGRGSP